MGIALLRAPLSFRCMQYASGEFLKKGEMQNLTYGEYSTDLIMKGMRCSYPEALVIVRNMEQFPDYADFFFVPRMVE